MSSFVVGKERCPKCALTGKDRKGDNLAIYNDGHKWCFSCGYWLPGDTLYKVRQLEQPKEDVKIEKILPDDVIPCTYGKGYHWLKSYELTNIEIAQNKILWSEQNKWLIFPLIDEHDNILMWQARNFNKEKPYKYYTKGNVLDNLWLIGNKSDYIVLVEDVVSAIKVGRVGYALPILGSNIATSLLSRLKFITDTIYIWLDPDKQKEMVSFSTKALRLGWNVKTIFSDKDPKDYGNDQIKKFITS